MNVLKNIPNCDHCEYGGNCPNHGHPEIWCVWDEDDASEALISEIHDVTLEWAKKIIDYGDPDYYIPFPLALKGYDKVLKLISDYRDLESKVNDDE